MMRDYVKNSAESRNNGQRSAERTRASAQPSAGSQAKPRALAPIPQRAGNLAIQRLLASGAIRTKLRVGQRDDPYEREADRMAAQVVSSQRTPPTQRRCSACAEGSRCPQCAEEQTVRLKGLFGHQPQATAELESSLAALTGTGTPLPSAIKDFFESRFAVDFGPVRLHAGSESERLNRALGARAFTHGRDIYLGEGGLDIESGAGRELLAHELTHVVQQDACATGRHHTLSNCHRSAQSPSRPTADSATHCISKASTSIQRYSWDWDELKQDARSAGESVIGAFTNAADSVKTSAAAVADLVSNWRTIQLDWNSPPALLIASWAKQLDPETIRNIRSKGSADLYDQVAVPADVEAAAGSLATLLLEFRPPLPTRTPLIEPGIKPGVSPTPGRPPFPGIPAPLLALIIFIIIMLIPSNIFEHNTEDEELEKARRKREEEKKTQDEERKKKKEAEKGKCRQTIPGLKGAIHEVTIQLLDRNANIFLDRRLGDTPRDRHSFGTFFHDNAFFFFLAIVTQTKNTILKVCSLTNNTLGFSAGNKLIDVSFHAEELAAPPLEAQLRSEPIEERTGATLFNVCQSRACAQNARNADGCTAVLESIRNQLLPGGEVVDEPTGFPQDLRAQTDAALLRQMEARLPA